MSRSSVELVEEPDRVLAAVSCEVAVVAVDHRQARAHVAGEVEGGDAGSQLALFNQEQASHHAARVSWGLYLLDPDLWEKTLQNWQSEFLAVGTMVVFTIHLRQRCSPESKPGGQPHDETATSG